MSLDPGMAWLGFPQNDLSIACVVIGVASKITAIKNLYDLRGAILRKDIII